MGCWPVSWGRSVIGTQCHGDGGNDTPLSNTAHFRDEECARWIGGMLRTYTAGNTLGRSVYTADGWGPECTRQGPVWDGECTRPKTPPIVHNFRHGRLPTMYAFRPFLYTVGTRWGREVRTAGAFFAAFTPRPRTFLTVRALWHPRARRRASCTLSVPNGCPPLRGLSFRKAGVEVRVERLADGGPDAGAHAVRARYHGVGSWEGGAAWAYTRTPGKAPSRRTCTPPGSSQRAETDSHLVHGKGG